MAVYKTPKNLTLGYSPSVKPTVPVVVDWSNSITKDMIGCWSFQSGSLVNLVTGKLPETTNGTLVQGTFDGVESIYLNSSGRFTETLPYKSGDLTVITMIKPSSATPVSVDYDVGILELNTIDPVFWLDANGSQLRTAMFAGSSTFGTNGEIDLNNFNTVAFVSDSTGACKAYVNGIIDISSTMGAYTLDSTEVTAIFSNTVRAPEDAYCAYYYLFNRKLSESEIKSLHENPYQLLKPQIETFYYTAGSGGGTITGSGSPTASTATSTGTGSVAGIISGSGSPQAQTATASATGLRVITGTGAPQSGAATSTGAGSIGGTVSGTGTPQADNATASGVGLRVITGSGTPNATTATSNGAGLRLISGTGTSQAENATASGTGATGNSIIGIGTPQAGLATASGAGLRVITGAGNVQATTATTSSTGKRIIAGTGAASAELATSTGIALRVITGSGNAQAEIATAIGYDVATTIYPGRIYTVETENRIYTKETEDRTYAA